MQFFARVASVLFAPQSLADRNSNGGVCPVELPQLANMEVSYGDAAYEALKAVDSKHHGKFEHRASVAVKARLKEEIVEESMCVAELPKRVLDDPGIVNNIHGEPEQFFDDILLDEI